nr:hypothetical protein [Synechocystis sp. PCC 7509]
MNWINANDSTASFLADTTEIFSLNIISTNTTVGQDSFLKQTFYTITQIEFPSPRKIGIGEVASFKSGFTNSSIFKDSSSKIDISESTLSKRSASKISPWHITFEETTFIHTGADEFSKAQVTFVEPTQLEIGVGEVGLMVNNSFIDSIDPVNLNFPTSLIFFPSSVLSNQFFSIHDSTPQIIDRD